MSIRSALLGAFAGSVATNTQRILSTPSTCERVVNYVTLGHLQCEGSAITHAWIDGMKETLTTIAHASTSCTTVLIGDVIYPSVVAATNTPEFRAIVEVLASANAICAYQCTAAVAGCVVISQINRALGVSEKLRELAEDVGYSMATLFILATCCCRIKKHEDDCDDSEQEIVACGDEHTCDDMNDMEELSFELLNELRVACLGILEKYKDILIL